MTTLATQAPPAIFHITHWKAGSQWVRGVFEDLFADRLIEPSDSMHFGQFDAAPSAGAIYSPLYITRRSFETSAAAGVPHRKFIVIRDLRDTLVSWYFSLRTSHPANGVVDTHRPVLQKLPVEKGLLHLVNHPDFYALAMIPATWRTSDCLIVRFEDLLAEPGQSFSRIFEHCGLEVAPDRLAGALQRWSFEAKAGRARGHEDAGSHFRKGVAGDWRNHFTPEVRDAFKTRYADLLFRLGYEPTVEWF